MDRNELLDRVIAIAREAGELTLRYYDGAIEVDDKVDGSPVTAADRAADALIVPALEALTPDIPVVSEESVAEGRIPDVSGGRFWLVDPLDGTKEFINKRGDFTVNIGLIENLEPVLGVVVEPVAGITSAGTVGAGAFDLLPDGTRTPIAVAAHDGGPATVVVTKSHRTKELEAYLTTLDIKAEVSRGSALKFCLVARGEADLYPRVSPTMEWDTAAGHAVLLAAGGSMTDFDGAPFRYGKPDFLNGWFIARGR